jgi:hypothetical protein
MRRSILILLAALAVVVAAPSAAQAHQFTTVGPAFNIFTGNPSTYPAGQPFHFLLGFDLPNDGSVDAIGKYSVALEVDGTLVEPDQQFFGPLPARPGFLGRVWAWNFPSGLSAGVHTFTASFYTPCYATDGPCSNPNEVVLFGSRTMTVTFT